jgi:LTXXQ motif family protein
MSMTRVFAASMLAVCMALWAAAPGVAQQAESKPATRTPDDGYVLMPGVLSGPGAIGPIGRRRFCDARSVGLTQLQTTWVARLLKPNETQKKALDDLAAASGKSIDMIASACPKRTPRLQTVPEQFEMMEKRIENAMQAVRTVRPAFSAFYASLDDKQKAKLDELGPKRSGWLW